MIELPLKSRFPSGKVIYDFTEKGCDLYYSHIKVIFDY